MSAVDLSKYQNKMTRKNQLARLIWNITWAIFARPLPRKVGNSWKLFLLRLFGAKVHSTSVVYSSARIYMPWQLELAENSWIGPEVDCYNVAKIKIGPNSIISQKTYLCAASHDISKFNHPLISKPIIIEDQVWIGASAFVGMGVTIKSGAVVGATASVYKDVDSWTVVGGNPAVFLKKRSIE
jgi:putative colanic acid biosynthesis acetyltransferase WcaF